MLLSDLIMNWHVFEPCVWWWFQNYIASATAVELGVVIFILELWCTMNYLWTLCNVWHGCWIMYDLGWYVGCFEVLRDTRRTIGFIWAQVWQRDRSSGWPCTCALINWSVLLHDDWLPRGVTRKPITPRGGTLLQSVKELIDPISEQWDEQLLAQMF